MVAVVGKHRMERRVRTGSSYLSSSEKTATFGLGSASRVDSLLIYWPSARVDRFATIEGQQEIHVLEGAGVFTQKLLPGKKAQSNQAAP